MSFSGLRARSSVMRRKTASSYNILFGSKKLLSRKCPTVPSLKLLKQQSIGVSLDLLASIRKPASRLSIGISMKKIFYASRSLAMVVSRWAAEAQRVAILELMYRLVIEKKIYIAFFGLMYS